MANKFLSNINLTAGLEADGDSGSSGQILTSTDTGVAWVSPETISSESAEHVQVLVKNTSGATIAKGTPVYVTGETGNSGKIEIAPADSSDSAKMPALGLLLTSLNDNGEGYCVTGGLLEGLATGTIDSVGSTANDTVYVKPGGGLTLTKPTGSGNLIQNVAKVARVHASNGSLIVSSILRTNDVPNLPTGKIWVGDGNTTVSDTVFLDEPNGRMGIGTTSPTGKLDVREANVTISTSNSMSDGIRGLKIEGTNAGVEIAGSGNDWWVSALGSGLSIYDTTVDSYRFKILNNGNVGIGTTSPSKKLHVVGDAKISPGGTGQTLLLGRSNGQPSIKADTDNGGHMIIDSTSNFMSLNHYVSQNVILAAGGGSVGIGTTSPITKLTVETSNESLQDVLAVHNGITGTSALGKGAAIRIGSGNNGNYSTKIATIYEGNNPGYLQPALAFFTMHNTYLKDSEVERMRIASSGNVGIGTTSPERKLHVDNSSGVGEAVISGTTGATLYFRPNASYSLAGNFGIFATGLTSGTYESTMDFKGYYNGVTTPLTIKGSGNVGIGTTSPERPLHVLNTSSQTVAIFDGGNNSASEIAFKDAATSGGTYVTIGSIGNNMSLSAGASERMRITSSGNVGIGTTSPGAKLDVNGEIRSDKTVNGISFSSTGGGASFSAFDVYTATNGGLLRLYDENGQTVNIDGRSASGDTYFNNGGNVGIGTTSPSQAKLVVNGDIAIPRSNSLVFLENISGTFRAKISSQDSNPYNGLEFFTGNDASTVKMVIEDAGNVGIGVANPSTKLHVGGIVQVAESGNTAFYGGNYLRVFNDQIYTMRNTSGNQRFAFDNGSGSLSTYNSSNTRTTYLNNTGSSYINGGNVGIGTTNPLQPLSIESSTSPLIKIRNTTNAGGAAIEFNDNGSSASTQNGRIVYRHSDSQSQGGGSTFELLGEDDQTLQVLNNGRIVVQKTGSATEVGYGFYNDINTGMYSPGADTLALSTGGNNRLHINSSGNVGIGTINPAVTLDVNGGGRFNTNTGATPFYITRNGANDQALKIYVDDEAAVFESIQDETANGYGSFQFRLDAGVTEPYFDINKNNTNLFRVNGNGNVGIGTTSPSQKLDVNGNAYISGQAQASTAVIKTYSGHAMFGSNSTAEPIALGRDAANLDLVVATNGNVGIGTTSFFGKLSVNEAGSGVYFTRHSGDNGTTGPVLAFANDSTKSIIAAAGDGIIFRTRTVGGAAFSGSEKMRITSGGNVGIGTTSPSQKLHVAGNMRLQNQLYDSTNSTGTNGDVLTKVSAGTEWKVPAVNAQMPDNTAPASPANVGTIRYRSTSNTSFVDVSMQTGATTYAWVNIVSNFW